MQDSLHFYSAIPAILHIFAKRKRDCRNTCCSNQQLKKLDYGLHKHYRRKNQIAPDNEGNQYRQIRRIEDNIDIPSLAPLIKIARALGVRLGTFLDDQTNEDGPVVCRKGDADDTISFSNNASDARQHMHYHSLSKAKSDRHMDPFIIDIDENGETQFSLSAHEGEEFIMVLKGKLEVEYGKKKYVLEEGDTIYYDSIVPHHVHAYEGKAARILAVVYTPIEL